MATNRFHPDPYRVALNLRIGHAVAVAAADLAQIAVRDREQLASITDMADLLERRSWRWATFDQSGVHNARVRIASTRPTQDRSRFAAHAVLDALIAAERAVHGTTATKPPAPAEQLGSDVRRWVFNAVHDAIAAGIDLRPALGDLLGLDDRSWPVFTTLVLCDGRDVDEAAQAAKLTATGRS